MPTEHESFFQVGHGSSTHARRARYLTVLDHLLRVCLSFLGEAALRRQGEEMLCGRGEHSLVGVHDVRGNHKSTEVMLISFPRASPAVPLSRGEPLQFFGFVILVCAVFTRHVVLANTELLTGNESSVHICLCFFFRCSWSGHRVHADWVSEILRLACCDVHVY